MFSTYHVLGFGFAFLCVCISIYFYLKTFLESKGGEMGTLFRWASCWVGVHWSTYNKRACINFIPFVTIWIMLPGGKTPSEGH